MPTPKPGTEALIAALETRIHEFRVGVAALLEEIDFMQREIGMLHDMTPEEQEKAGKLNHVHKQETA